MTSDATHDLTEKFLYQNEFFGLKEENVKLFKQQQLPCFDMDGNLFLEERDELATAPDGIFKLNANFSVIIFRAQVMEGCTERCFAKEC